ncbi:MAG: autotransporter domain-containing protein [Phaeodactylibacter sp.]|nr:autotransporter domain-containing protein [Phaeodactylibacter sp.]MCB9276615.1 autotransporter domain-containing protein [Lewinellaceae bacterium]
MKYLVTLALSLFLSGTAFSQFGLNATYRSNTAPDWQFVNFNEEEALLPASAIAFGVDYWIPLKTVRIDLLPELNFSKMSSTLDSRANTQLDNTWLSLYLNANIYFLNLEGDCDCPTFSKSGGVFDKGLFLQLSPGATWMRNEVSAEGQSQDSNDFAFSIAAGLGLDLGLSDFLTLTPFAGLRYYLPTQWQSLELLQENGGIKETYLKDDTSSLRQLYGGLRLGFRLR